MRQQQTIEDVGALLRARNSLLWIVSREELRVERALIGVAGSLKMDIRTWDCADGIQNGVGETIDAKKDPLQALDYIGGRKERALYVMRDLHQWFDPQVLRTLRSLARKLQGASRNEARAIAILTSSSEIPPELAGQATVIDWPLPDREEMGVILDDVLSSLDDSFKEEALPKNGAREAAIDAAVGLTAEEAQNSYAKSLVTERCIDPGVVSAEKKRIIAKSGVLTWYDPDPRGLDSIGGLDELKEWLVDRAEDFTAKARDYGIPPPKGVFLLGPAGTGKSQTAKAVATAFGLPLLRLDPGGLKSKYVGDSEQNARKAFATADTVAPSVLWIDEIDKALAGSTGPQGDGGVSSDFLGAFLTWMQDHAGAVFVVATANDVSDLPSALLRKGRFDEMFFVDLPTSTERREVLAVALRKYGRDPDVILKGKETAKLVAATAGFSGAEIDALVPDALHRSFKDDGREVTVADLLIAAKTVVPLSKTTDDIDKLREWAKGRTRSASTPEASVGSDTRAIEL